MEQKFKVIYLGELQADTDLQSVALLFADKFKISPDKATKILNANKEVTLHKGAEHVKAYKLKSALENLGLLIRLERLQILKATEKPAPQLSLIPNESNTIAETKKSTDTEPKIISTEPDSKTDQPKVAVNFNSNEWALEPIKAEPSETEEAEEAEELKVTAKQEYVDLRIPSRILEKKTVEPEEVEIDKGKNKVKKEQQPSAIMVFVKQFGGVIAAGLVGVLFLAKKFGLLKFLKIGAVMATAAYAGYNPEEACMDNDDCEDAVSDQIDSCWSYSELDQYDWDNMSEEQYFELKPKVEEEFIACFRYEDTGERVLESPIELRFDLIDMCEMLSSPVSGCETMAESQLKFCYNSSHILEPIKASDYDYYTTMMTDMDYFIDFYGCFKDDSGNMLFAEFVNELNSGDMQEAWQIIQDEMEGQ